MVKPYGSRLGRGWQQRVMMLRNMLTSLIRHERIETTFQKAKAVQRVAERSVTWGKTGTLATRRRALGYINDKDMVEKLFTVMAQRYAKRAGGYTRVLRTRYRVGDGALMAYVEFVDREGELRPARPPPAAAAAGAGPAGAAAPAAADGASVLTDARK